MIRNQLKLRLTQTTFSALLLATTAYAEQPQNSEEVPVLSGIVIEEDKETNQVGYVAKKSSSATKTDTPIIDTPQSITVITEQQIKDQGAQTVQDALRYTAGVRGETYGLDSRGDWSTIRGTDPVVYLDGMQQTFGYYASSRPDPYTLEAIEVIKGPSSVLYGQGSVGGIVNLRTKRPQEERAGEIRAEYGTFNRMQLGADLTGAVNEDATVLYRAVALGRESDTQVQQVGDDRLLFAPAITFKPTPGMEWTVLANYQEDKTGSTTQFLPHAGTVLDSPHGLPQIPIDVFMSEPGFDAYDTTQKAVTSLFSYEIDDTWTVRQNVRFADSKVNYQTIYPAFPPVLQASGDIDRVYWVANPDLRYWTIDNQLQADLKTGPVEQKILAGLDSQYAVTTRRWAYGAAGTLNLFDPVYGNFTPPTDENFFDDPKNTIEQIGVYLQDQITLFDRLIAVAGVRGDWAKNSTESPEDSTTQRTDKVTMRAALMYKTNLGVSPYISYSESFLPLIGINSNGDSYKPLEGEQYEVGVKYQPAESNSYLTAAVFDLTEKNRQTPDPSDPMNQLQSGKAESRGFEIEALGEVTSRWNLIANYSYTDTEVVKGDPDYDQGKRLPTVPSNMASLWSQHQFSIGELDGFRAGMGVRFVGSSWDGTDSLKTPSTTLVDAMVGYDFDDWSVAINGNNLDNETYYTTCLARGDCFVGSKRTVVGSVSYRF